MDLKCANAIRYENKHMKPIKCKLTNSNCVCASCLNEHIGFKINPWINKCPAFLEIIDEERPYILEIEIIKIEKYNPNYGNDRICKCGHSYYRHFDSYQNMDTCGCKYCGCFNFIENNKGE